MRLLGYLNMLSWKQFSNYYFHVFLTNITYCKFKWSALDVKKNIIILHYFINGVYENSTKKVI